MAKKAAWLQTKQGGRKSAGKRRPGRRKVFKFFGITLFKFK